MASDPFAEPLVTVGLLMKAGVGMGPLIVERPLAVEFVEVFSRRDPTADNNTVLLQHNAGIVVVELNHVASVSVSAGSPVAARELIDLVK